jgi:catechol 2,3-dioxygenase-like lactoylglutathione lyase family enzyme
MSLTKVLFHHTPIYHLSYFVPDVREASLRHHEMFGSGPFVVAENPQKTTHTYKGQPFKINITMSTGWWGDLAVEFIQQNSEGPSYFKDNGRFGFHHICFGVSDVKAAIADFEANGCTVAVSDFSRENYPYAYIDARKLYGMYMEINPGPDAVYKVVKKWAQDWDKKTDVIRDFDVFMAEVRQG